VQFNMGSGECTIDRYQLTNKSNQPSLTSTPAADPEAVSRCPKPNKSKVRVKVDRQEPDYDLRNPKYNNVITRLLTNRSTRHVPILTTTVKREAP